MAAKDRSAAMIEVAREFKRLGFAIKATAGPGRPWSITGWESDMIEKLHGGWPNVDDAIKNRGISAGDKYIHRQRASLHDDSHIRKAAIKYRVRYITTIAAASAVAKGIAPFRGGSLRGEVSPGIPCGYQIGFEWTGR